MAYATQSDMTTLFGEREVIQITDRALMGVIDSAVLGAALDLASDEIDGYIGSRYPLPLSESPRLLVRVCCDIARYRLLGADAQETEPARNRYKDAIALLKQVRDGDMGLGLTPTAQPVGTGSTVKIFNGTRQFGAGSLDDY